MDNESKYIVGGFGIIIGVTIIITSLISSFIEMSFSYKEMRLQIVSFIIASIGYYFYNKYKDDY